MWTLQLKFIIMFDRMLKHGILALVIYSGWSQLSAMGISRSDVITRAQFWTNNAVPYNQTANHSDPNGKFYRTDCSGFVSMAWNLSSSLDTTSLPKVSRNITKQDLKQGDIILKSAGDKRHVVIFDKWTSNTKTRYWAYDQTPPKAIYHEIRYPYWDKPGYTPYRFKNIVEESVDNSANGPCACPERYIQMHHNALIIAFCGSLMTGRCNPNNAYLCFYRNCLPQPTLNNSFCPFGHTVFEYVHYLCENNE